jgi:acetyl-CoA acetyltransferase
MHTTVSTLAMRPRNGGVPLSAPKAVVAGQYVTPFGKQTGKSSQDLQVDAALGAMEAAGVHAGEVDAVIAGYSTVANHLMPANALSERMGIKPNIAFGTSVGGATGLAMVAQGVSLITSGQADTVLIAAGENRATGFSREDSTQVLAQVAHPDYEVPLGGAVPSYYALLASHYDGVHSLPEGNRAPLAVQMRRHAAATAGAHFSKQITENDVLASKVIAAPLRLLECCPVSDGGAAVILRSVHHDGSSGLATVTGLGQAHLHQHISEIDLENTGARIASSRALAHAGVGLEDIDVFGVYDSFTITLAMILEEIGLVPPGKSGEWARDGVFDSQGRLPLNTHGGLLSYGHSGVAGGLAHFCEVALQIQGKAGYRQLPSAKRGYVHADGGILSAHVALVLERLDEVI